jgi:hypothetical protein
MRTLVAGRRLDCELCWSRRGGVFPGYRCLRRLPMPNLAEQFAAAKCVGSRQAKWLLAIALHRRLALHKTRPGRRDPLGRSSPPAFREPGSVVTRLNSDDVADINGLSNGLTRSSETTGRPIFSFLSSTQFILSRITNRNLRETQGFAEAPPNRRSSHRSAEPYSFE